MYKVLQSCFVLFMLVISLVAKAQIEPDINSGNPAVPFPQFQPYVHPDGTKLGNLADHNPEGVPHAEMEQRTRDAWKMMCNNLVEVKGAVVGGVQYVASQATLDCNCAEGYGYYLLGAALMSDKKIYDALYMYVHDNSFNGVTRFIDGVENPYGGYNRGLSYAGSFGAGAGHDPRGGGISGNSAADGDHDIALALMVAYKQWGEKSGIIANGKEINYKEEALNYIRAMADTGVYSGGLPDIKYYSGVIGLDGYIKGGDTWNELTDFAANGYKGIKRERTGGDPQHFDYYAPAYYRQFADWLEAEGENPWLISQYRRGEASSDWLMGKLYEQGEQKLPFAGWVALDGEDAVFSTFNGGGEDFRAPWRTILNYTWHGSPSYGWDPVTHEIVPATTNTYEKDMAVRLAKFMKNQQGSPWNLDCDEYGTGELSFKGPSTIYQGYTPDGVVTDDFTLNFIHGTASPGVVAAQDYETMAQMFRQCLIEWDAHNPGYIESKPLYFHEWFRLLGLLMLSGNHHAPLSLNPGANLKVYHSLDKTMAFNNDRLQFTIDYRNYGSLDATNSKITIDLPSDISYITSSIPATASGSKITFDLGTVTGFKTGNLEETKGSFTVDVRLSSDASGNYCISPVIECSNGTGWTSNEYPNRQTAIMERNCVDVVKRALKVNKYANRDLFNPGDTVSYSIDFTNSSEAGWIDGGRPGVNFAFAHDGIDNPASATGTMFKFRIFNDAAEPYIDYGNYRFSYFLNEPTMNCLISDSSCSIGWGLNNDIYEGGEAASVTFFREAIFPGTDSTGSWNQRVGLRFAPQLSTTTQHLLRYSGSPNRIKEGGLMPLRATFRFYTSNHSPVAWDDDWSWQPEVGDDDGGMYYPVTPDWTNPFAPPIDVNYWHRNSCETSAKTVSKILVEEWDGYVWRRVFGNGPLPGRDIEDVVITDTLPQGITFAGFTGRNPFGVAPSYDSVNRVITWKIDKLLISQQGKINYRGRVNIPSGSNCPTANENIISEAWIQGKSESPFAAIDTIAVTCTKVIVCNPLQDFTITTDKPEYTFDDSLVSYNVNYIQKHGTIGKSSLSSINDWTIRSGSGVTIADGILQGMNGSDFIITHNFSHGTNTLEEGIQGTLKIASYAKFGIVLRFDPVTEEGIYMILRRDFASTHIEIFDNTSSIATGLIPLQRDDMDFQIKLQGDKLNMWLGDAPFEGPIMYSVSGLPVRAGYAGFIHGTVVGENTSNHQVTYWNAHLDSGFDLNLRNPLPTGVSSFDMISEGGTFATDNITWTLSEPGTPILYNTEFSVSFRAHIKDCSEGIANKAYASMRGHEVDAIQTCHLIKCVSDGPADSLTLTVENDTENLSALLKWTTTSNDKALEFIVTKSQGGSVWRNIATVPAEEGSSSYSFTDRNPTSGISYYQVKQVNKDGSSMTSTIVTFGYNGDLSFKVDNVNSTAVASWMSAYEFNTATYEVQRSHDGVNWQTMHTTDALGTNKLYTYTDVAPWGGSSFYRIRQVFTDGTSLTSIVITFEGVNSVNDGLLSKSSVFLFPNPASTELNIHWNAPSTKNYEVRLRSSLGVVVLSQSNLISGASQTLDLPKNLAAGTYVLEVISESQGIHLPVLIQ